MMASLTNLETKCRFALLEISDDDNDEEEEEERKDANTAHKSIQGGGNKSGQNSSENKSTKKSKKKKLKSKGNAGATEKTATAQEKEWSNWMARDEQYVLSQFQRDLQAALEESKKEATPANKKPGKAQEVLEAISMAGSGKEQKKKKEKAVSMSLDEFVSGMGAGKAEHPNQKQQPQQELSTRMMALDTFTVESTPTDTDTSPWYTVNGSSCVVEEPSQEIRDEKPPQGTKVKKSSRKRDTSKSEEDPSKDTSEPKSSGEKKLVTATKEDQLKREEMQAQAEIVFVQEELDKKNAMFEKLKKAFKAQNVTIEELKKELVQVKKRNKQLCFILSQAEMKEKSELVMQIEELNEVREQVVQLHAELEQERSRSSAFKSELAKYQGRTRHGSSS